MRLAFPSNSFLCLRVATGVGCNKEPKNVVDTKHNASNIIVIS